MSLSLSFWYLGWQSDIAIIIIIIIIIASIVCIRETMMMMIEDVDGIKREPLIAFSLYLCIYLILKITKKKFVSINFFSTIKNILDLDSHFFLYQMNEWTHMKNDDDDDNKD